MKPPTISVLIPTFNYARFLPEAIESVLDQDFADFELLIADDASKDNSAEVIARYAARDSRIRVQIHQSNQGMVRNWNWCLSNARGEYIRFLFGDDKLASPHALRTMLEALKAHPSAVPASSPRIIIDAESRILKVIGPLSPGLHKGPEVIARCIHEYGNPIGEPSAVMFRRRDAQRGFDLSYRQVVDLEMWLALMRIGGLVHVEEPLTCFRKHESQQSNFNRAHSINRSELARLFWSVTDKELLRPFGWRRLVFRQLYEMRKTRRLCTDVSPPEEELRSKFGGHWYPLLWLSYKMQRPARQLRLWMVRKHCQKFPVLESYHR